MPEASSLLHANCAQYGTLLGAGGGSPDSTSRIFLQSGGAPVSPRVLLACC